MTSTPAHPPSRKAPLVWAIGAAIPWLVLAVGAGGVVRRSTRGCSWLHALAAAVTVLGIVVFVVVVPVWRYRVHRWDIDATGGVHPHGLAGAGTPHRADLAGADRRHLTRAAGPAVRAGQRDGDDGVVGGRGAHRRAGLGVADRVVAQLTDIAAIGGEDAT